MMPPRLLRIVVRALLLALVPVFGIGASGAQAVVYGSTGTASVEFSSWRPGDDGNCAVVAYYVGGVGLATSVKFKVTCDGGWNSALGDSGATSAVQFQGSSGCLYATSVTYAEGGKASGTAAQGGIGPIVGGCAAQEVCMDFTKVQTGFDTHYDRKCVGIDLGALPQEDAPVGACQYGKAAKPTIGPYEWPGGSEYNTFGRRVTTPLTDNPSGAWAVIVVNKGGAEKPYYSVDLTGETLGQELSMERLNQFLAPGPGDNWDRLADYYGPQTTRIKKGDIVGVQLAQTGSGLGVRDWEKLPQTGVPGGALGVTDPSRCLYYYGERIADVANSTIDEPAGALSLDGSSSGGTGTTVDPDPVDPVPDAPSGGPCDFSFSNPASWASAGICALVDLFRYALEILGDIATAIGGIAGAILDGLVSLFVPSDGYIGGKVDQLKDAWADTPPGVVIAEVGDIPAMFVAPSSSGCAGVPLSLDLPMSGPVELHPFDACGSDKARLAAIVRIAVQLTVGVGAFFAGVRILGSAFGLDTSMGRGADS